MSLMTCRLWHVAYDISIIEKFRHLYLCDINVNISPRFKKKKKESNYLPMMKKSKTEIFTVHTSIQYKKLNQNNRNGIFTYSWVLSICFSSSVSGDRNNTLSKSIPVLVRIFWDWSVTVPQFLFVTIYSAQGNTVTPALVILPSD